STRTTTTSRRSPNSCAPVVVSVVAVASVGFSAGVRSVVLGGDTTSDTTVLLGRGHEKRIEGHRRRRRCPSIVPTARRGRRKRGRDGRACRGRLLSGPRDRAARPPARRRAARSGGPPPARCHPRP